MASFALNPESHYSVMPMTNSNTPGRGILESLPVELILEIMKTMSPRDLSRLALLSKKLYAIFKENQATVMSSILLARPEFETMLYLYTADDRDFVPGQMLHSRIIDFDAGNESGAIINFLSANATRGDGDTVSPEKKKLNTWDLIELWKWTKVIDWWVELYPTLRWRDHPEDRRCLRSHEEARLRKAVARWWLYAWYFHGVHYRDLYLPHKWRNDKRLHHIRVMSTREICELEDLWGLMFETVSRDLCSSPERVRVGKRAYAVELVPWGSEDGRHNNIVNTYLKLDPEQLKYFLELYHRRKRMDVINAVRSSTREFNLDRETLSISITTVLEERMMLTPKDVTNIPRSGIVDEDREDDKQGDFWSVDASPNGQPPLTQAQINAFPLEYDKRLPYGDDGSDEPY
ncbi:hypothetical protein DL762_004704 [Monosporascus cannonballus]|uniref:F-box domain-containing protein n=1 Tax=Monosporascus cannonballus TaxID=155416 RepID=A0ABY0H6Y4_9PEZI|nr:hypothetical protein DL762_004704 [Monosporascus cannonballus]RYO98755.1 hypothetical protein DL763_002016 [Monosporascus cannonballus]